jgi:hypothetical protein
MDAPFGVKLVPSTSAKQEKFMRAVANSPKFAKKVGVPQSVGKEFEMKDKKGYFGGGVTKKPVGTGKPVGGMPNISGSKGSVAPMPSRDNSARRPNPRTRPGFSDGGTTKMTKSEMPSKMGKVKTSPTRDGVAKKGKTKGTMVKMMKSGGAC